MAAKGSLADVMAAPGPIIQSAVGQVDEATETTRLLKHRADEVIESTRDVHWRNIESSTKFWLLYGSILFGNTIAFFDSTLMASAHPVITSDFNASNAASWLSTVFYLTSTVSQPIYGRVSDTIGRRLVLSFATITFFISTALCGLAPSIGSFIAARALAGIGAGGVMSVSAVITSDVVKIEYRGIYQSYYNMAYGFGNGLGAALGGWLCDVLGWRWAFGVQLPFIFVFVLLAWTTCPARLGPDLQHREGKSVAEAFATFDAAGATVLTVTVVCLILGINIGGALLPWRHPLPITALVIAFIGCCALPPVSRRATRPVLPLPLLTTPPTSYLMWSTFFFSLCNNAVLFNVPLFLQAVRQTTPTVSGLYLISPLAGVSLAAIFTGFYITWSRRMKPTLAVGVILLFLGIIATVCLDENLPLWVVLMLIPWTSVGQGLVFPTATIAVLALNAEGEQAIVVTTNGLLRSLGAIHGVAISSWVLQNALPIYLEKDIAAKTPEMKQAIVKAVRKSVRAIATLDPEHKAQAIKAYSQSLRVTFAWLIIFAFLVVCIILPLKVPRLQTQKERDQEEQAAALAASGDGVMDSEDDSEGDEDPRQLSRTLTRRTSHAHSLQLGRRVSHDTTL